MQTPTGELESFVEAREEQRPLVLGVVHDVLLDLERRHAVTHEV